MAHLCTPFLLSFISLALHALGQNITTNLPQVEYPAFNSTVNDGAANITSYIIEDDGPNGSVQTGHLSILHNPLGQFVVLPPTAGCASSSGGVTTGGRSLTSTTAAAGNCHVAANGALFNVTSGGCLGNLVSNGAVIQAPGTQNVNFGIRNGSFVTGYVSALEAQGRAPGKAPFEQLVSGVVWLVKDGVNYVQQDLPYEDPTTQTTGTIQVFASIVSARTAIGHNAAGEILLLQLDGQSNVRGKTLYEVADILISYGAVNAINLDGGGSSTYVTNGILSSYPSDKYNTTINNQSFSFRQERAVTSVVCFKDRFPIAPAQVCDPTSQNPNQCFNAYGTLSICCPGACPPSPGPLAVCASATAPSSPVTGLTPPVTAATSSVITNPTAAPTTAAVPPAGSRPNATTGPSATPAPAVTSAPPVTSAPALTSAPAVTSAPGVAAGTQPPCNPTSGNPNECFNAPGTASLCCPGQCPQNPGPSPSCGPTLPPSPTFARCDPLSSTPNQCFNAAGTASVCCAGQCPQTPGANPVCGPTLAPSPTFATCDPLSSTPNQCFNADGSQSICCPGQCPGSPGPTAACGGPSPATGSPGTPIGSPGTPIATSASGSATGGSPPCDPTSGLPNQCFNAPGTAFICCPGQCPNNPGPTPACA